MNRAKNRAINILLSLMLALVIVGMFSAKNSPLFSRAITTISPVDAVAFSLVYAQDTDSMGGIAGEVTEIRGATMPYRDAARIIYNDSLPEDKLDRADLVGKMIWFTILQGTFVTHSASPFDDSVAHVNHQQLCIVFDAVTGEIYQRTFIAPGTMIDVSTLPILSDDPSWNTNTPIPVPIQTPIRSTEVPMETGIPLEPTSTSVSYPPPASSPYPID